MSLQKSFGISVRGSLLYKSINDFFFWEIEIIEALIPTYNSTRLKKFMPAH